MAVSFGFCAPIFAGAHDHHPRTPLLERLDPAHLLRTVAEAESLGYDSVWVADHLILGRDGLVLEGWTTLTALSGVTSRMRLGTIHLANLFRAPSLTAKMVASLDFISGGRVEFFFEPGHRGSEPEASAYGFPFPDDATRVAMFEEALQVVRAMWSQDSPTFHGRYYHIEDAVCHPRPVQDPLPLWIGTIGGEPFADPLGVNDLMLDVIARHAHWWNNTPASVDYCRNILAQLEEACRRQGRDFATLRKSLETQVLVAETEGQVRRLQEAIEHLNPRRTFYPDWDQARRIYVIGDVKAVTRRLEEYTALGIERFLLWFMDYPSPEGMRLFARHVMPHFTGGGA